MIDFQLAAHEKASHLWQRLRAHLEDRLAFARMRNDAVLLSEHDTAALRGEIRSLKRLIALGDDPPMTGNDEQPPV